MTDVEVVDALIEAAELAPESREWEQSRDRLRAELLRRLAGESPEGE